MKQIAIVGAGGFGREVEMLIQQINDKENSWDFVGYYDDGIQKGEKVGEGTVIGSVADLAVLDKERYVVIAIGDPKTKRKIYEDLRANEMIKYPILIHPSVLIGRNVTIGEGSMVCAGNILTVDIIMGVHTILNLACTIGHDTTLGDFCSVMPGVNISGEVRIMDGAYIGTGAKIINQVYISENVTIGAGAVVTRNLPANCTAVGLPAKPLVR